MPWHSAHWLYIDSQYETVLAASKGTSQERGDWEDAVEVTSKDSVLIIRQTQAPKQQASCHPFLLNPTQIHSHGQRVTFLHNDSEHRP